MDWESQSLEHCVYDMLQINYFHHCVLREYRLSSANSLKLSASANITLLVHFLKLTSDFFLYLKNFEAKFLFHKGKQFHKQDQLYTYSNK